MPRIELETRGLVLLAVLLLVEGTLIFLLGWHFGSRVVARAGTSAGTGVAEAGEVAAGEAGVTGGAATIRGAAAASRGVEADGKAVVSGNGAIGRSPAVGGPGASAARRLAGRAGRAEVGADEAVPPRFAVQVGSFVVEEELEPFLEGLRLRGWPVYVVRTFNSAGNSLFEVRLGPFDSQAEARSWVVTAAEVARGEPWVLNTGPGEGTTAPATAPAPAAPAPVEPPAEPEAGAGKPATSSQSG